MLCHSWFRRFLRDEQGLEVIEFSIIMGIIVAGTIAIITAVGAWVVARFTGVQTGIMA